MIPDPMITVSIAQNHSVITRGQDFRGLFLHARDYNNLRGRLIHVKDPNTNAELQSSGVNHDVSREVDELPNSRYLIVELHWRSFMVLIVCAVSWIRKLRWCVVQRMGRRD
jgi:hypothetical protein